MLSNDKSYFHDIYVLMYVFLVVSDVLVVVVDIFAHRGGRADETSSSGDVALVVRLCDRSGEIFAVLAVERD